MFDEGGFTGSVVPEDGDAVPFFDFEGDVFEYAGEFVTIGEGDVFK